MLVPILTLLQSDDEAPSSGDGFTSSDRSLLRSILALLRMIVLVDTTVVTVVNSKTFTLVGGANSSANSFDQRTVLLFDTSNNDAVATAIAASWDPQTLRLTLLQPPPFTVAPGDRVVVLAVRDAAFANPALYISQ